MNPKQRFAYYARSNGINPNVLGKSIKISAGLMCVVGQRDHKSKPILVTIDKRKYAMPIWKLRILLLQYDYTNYLDMYNEQSNVDLWFKKTRTPNEQRKSRKNR